MAKTLLSYGADPLGGVSRLEGCEFTTPLRMLVDGGHVRNLSVMLQAPDGQGVRVDWLLHLGLLSTRSDPGQYHWLMLYLTSSLPNNLIAFHTNFARFLPELPLQRVKQIKTILRDFSVGDGTDRH
jgi:hypothetical protein